LRHKIAIILDQAKLRRRGKAKGWFCSMASSPSLTFSKFQSLGIRQSALLLLLASILLLPQVQPVAAQTTATELSNLSFIKKLRLARSGDINAQLSVAIDYEGGLNQARRDPVQAARWYREAALQGNLEALYRLSKMLRAGSGKVPQDSDVALQFLTDAAARGYGPAQNELGLRYQQGDGVPKDIGKAISNFELAAKQNVPSAQVNIGLLLVKGEGVAKDFDRAFKLFEQAAATGDVWALNNLGGMHEMGWGTPKNYEKARSFYVLAQGKGSQLATANLARLDSKTQ
jgi:uncharacterized protein